MNTASSGSGRVDDIKGHPQGQIRGQTKLVKPETRQKLTQLPFEEKIRMIGELIRLRQKIKTESLSEEEVRKSVDGLENNLRSTSARTTPSALS
jgi:hypothetical protein